MLVEKVAMSATLHLIRHCTQPDWDVVLCGRVRDASLDDAGRDQADRLAQALADQIAPVRIESSPRKRARETAEAIGAATNAPVIVADALDEIDFGEWAGRRFDELESDVRWRFWNSARDRAPSPGGETMVTVIDRATDHLRSSAAASPNGATLLYVTHADVIRGVIASWLGLPLSRLLAMDIDPGSMSTLAYDDQRGRVVSLNRRFS
jgi:ribonuclease H / adenosylcobalamin/alpha-ribazole phosphatase